VSALTGYFALVLRAHNLDKAFIPEYQFHPTRKWRADFADPVHKILVEIDGGAFTMGRHTRGAGYRADCEKLNAAAALGWRVFKYVEKKGMSQFIEDYQTIMREKL
jgi:very-short-patch-repair endonuclease